MIIIHNVLRGENSNINDTVAIIIKQKQPGNGPPLVESAHSNYPLLWIANEVSCLFLTDNIYPEEKEADQWSHFKKFNVIRNNNFSGVASIYDANTIAGKLIIAGGVVFKKKTDWYNYLRQYPDIKIPEGY